MTYTPEERERAARQVVVKEFPNIGRAGIDHLAKAWADPRANAASLVTTQCALNEAVSIIERAAREVRNAPPWHADAADFLKRNKD